LNIWLKRLLVSTFIIVQLWLVSITVQYPITAIIVEKNEQQQWLIKEFEKKEIPSALNLQLGDQVTSIDGQEPGQHFTVSRWSSISQFDTLTISRNGSSFEASTNALIHMDIWDYVSILGGIICFCLALIIYNKIGKFPSARLLSLIFINLSLIYISTGASSRSDGLGKLIIGTSMMTLPILFLHFFIVFFNEKGNLKLPTAFLKWLYVLPAITTVFRISFLTPVAHYFYQYNNGFILPYFLLGLLANFFVLGFIYLKYRKTNEYFSMIIKTVGVSLLISFLPFIISFIHFPCFLDQSTSYRLVRIAFPTFICLLDYGQTNL
jgi:two-component system sensor histidine kinase ComP